MRTYSVEEPLTLKELEAMEPHTMFANGYIGDDPQGVDMTTSGRAMRWVAVTGEIGDWAIYIYWSKSTLEFVRQQGDKVSYAHHIKKLVPCSEEALAAYRK